MEEYTKNLFLTSSEPNGVIPQQRVRKVPGTHLTMQRTNCSAMHGERSQHYKQQCEDHTPSAKYTNGKITVTAAKLLCSNFYAYKTSGIMKAIVSIMLKNRSIIWIFEEL